MDLLKAIDGYKSYLTGSSLILVSILQQFVVTSPETQAMLSQVVTALIGMAVIALKSAIAKKSPAAATLVDPLIDRMAEQAKQEIIKKLTDALNNPKPAPVVTP